MSKAPPSKAVDFTGGETDKSILTESAIDPRALACRILRHRGASVKEEVTGDAVLGEAVSKLRDDKEKLKQLMVALVDARVLSSEEADLGPDASKSRLCKLMKIGEHAEVILHEQILPFLQPGYSVLYQLVLLYKILEANDEHS